MNVFNNGKLAAKKKAGINIHLYSDDHPETTLKGTGFKDAATARRTLDLVKQKPRNRQVWTINAMFHRAKHHPNQTEPMREAMAIFRTWLEQYNAEKKNKTSKGHVKREAQDTPEVPDKKKQKIQSRSTLEQQYLTMFNMTLPAIAKEEGWPIHLNHCLMRVALDGYWQCCWYDKLDQKKGALKSMSTPQIENVIAMGEAMARKGKAYVVKLNQQSLAYRGKDGPGKHSTSIPKEGVAEERNNNNKMVQLPPNGSVKSGIGLLQVERASSGRASCRACKEKISKDAYRVGMQAWTSGRQVTVWQHPLCFVRGAVRVEKVDRGSTAKCKATGVKFSKGDLRVVLQVGSTKNYYAVTALKRLLVPVYTLPEVTNSQEASMRMENMQGIEQMCAEDRAGLLAAMA